MYGRECFDRGGGKGGREGGQLDLLEEIRGRDAIVIEVGEYWLPRIGFGFVRDLLKAYDALDAAQAAAAKP